MTNFTARISFGGTAGDGETLTVRFRLELINDALSKRIEKSFNQTTAL